MADKPHLSDKELRLECARLVMAFGASGDPVDAAQRLFVYIRSGDWDPLKDSAHRLRDMLAPVAPVLDPPFHEPSVGAEAQQDHVA